MIWEVIAVRQDMLYSSFASPYSQSCNVGFMSWKASMYQWKSFPWLFEKITIWFSDACRLSTVLVLETWAAPHASECSSLNCVATCYEARKLCVLMRKAFYWFVLYIQCRKGISGFDLTKPIIMCRWPHRVILGVLNMWLLNQFFLGEIDSRLETLVIERLALSLKEGNNYILWINFSLHRDRKFY